MCKTKTFSHLPTTSGCFVSAFVAVEQEWESFGLLWCEDKNKNIVDWVSQSPTCAY